MYDDGKTFTSNLFYCILFNSDRIFFVCPLMLSRVSLEFKIQFEVFCSSRCCKFFRLGIHNQNHCVNIVLMLLITTGTIPKLFFEIPASFQESYNSKKISMVCLRAQSKAHFSKFLLLTLYSDAQSKTQILSEQCMYVRGICGHSLKQF